MEEVMQGIGILDLAALTVFAVFYLIAIQPTINQCARAGYAAYKIVRGEGLCIGKVLVDGELVWVAEPLSDIREREGQ